MTTEELLLQSLRFQAESRTFGLATRREREVARHFYLLALEEVERGLDGKLARSPRDAA